MLRDKAVEGRTGRTALREEVYLSTLKCSSMTRKLLTFCFTILITSSTIGQKTRAGKTSVYFPSYQQWETRSPSALGLNQQAIDSAITRAIAGESKNTRRLEDDQAGTFGKEPFGDATGPMADRGHPTGLIIYKGYIIGSWGEPARCDMVHSVTKSFLSSVVGKAVDSGLISNVKDTVWRYMPPIELYGVNDQRGKPLLIEPFNTEHNKTITWDDMLRQTSDWEGTLWGKPEWADRPDSSRADWKNRPRLKSGSTFEYNDTRVNALALAATAVWRKPLPVILKDYILDPIGASNTWRWTGYKNSWITLDGSIVQSVSGGGHFGGGVFMNTYDLARFGLLTLHEGNWNGRQLISRNWIRQSLTPTVAKDDYGYMNWFLNTGKKMLPAAPETAFTHVGNGANLIYVDREHDLVVVCRWINTRALNGVVASILKAMPQ